MWFVYILAGVLCAVIGLITIQPSNFIISRSITIQASAESIFPHINNLEKFGAWNPWAKIDPNVKNTFEGPKDGLGAKLNWDGNKEVGQGSMTNVESRPNEYVQYRMDFIKPMQSTSKAEFNLKQDGQSTIVTWSMSGQNNFIGKFFSLVFNCDKMVGGQFEKGLTELKTIVEKK